MGTTKSEILRRNEVHLAALDQCVFGAETTKPTIFAYANMNLSTIDDKRCSHEVREFKRADGTTYRARHESLVGRRRTNERKKRKSIQSAWRVPTATQCEARFGDGCRAFSPGSQAEGASLWSSSLRRGVPYSPFGTGCQEREGHRKWDGHRRNEKSQEVRTKTSGNSDDGSSHRETTAEGGRHPSVQKLWPTSQKADQPHK